MIVFDIGAETGIDGLGFAREGHTVFAFEPNPHWHSRLEQIERVAPRYTLVKKAVSDVDGFAQFNVAKRKGCSSFYLFKRNAQKKWPGIGGLLVKKIIEVPTIRMDTFMRAQGIPFVDWLHCDAQGNDLEVLQSFGEQIEFLRGGVVEAWVQNPMYKGASNSVGNVRAFLKGNGFAVTSEESNDKFGNEVNIRFQRC